VIFHPDIYARPPAGIARIVDGLLAETVDRAIACSPYYRETLAAIGPVRTAADLASLPTTAKEALQSRPADFTAVPASGIAELVSTTGTTGAPVFVPMTRGDVERLAETERRGFLWLGAAPGMRFHLAATMDNLFVAGLAYHEGLRKIGATAVRVGVQPAQRHLDLMRALRPEGIVAVPSMMAALARMARETGIDLRAIAPRKALLIGDAIRGADLSSNALGRLIESAWGCELFSTYGLTESGGAFHECPAHRGLHCHPDLLLAEVVDDAGRPLPPGEIGELAITTLQTEAMPLIRYRTGDVTFVVEGDCPCGRGGLRIGPILGRKAHRLKVKGTTLYPKTLEDALVAIDGVENFVIEADSEPDGTDRLLVRVGTARAGDAAFRETVAEALLAKARVTPAIALESPAAVDASLYEGGRRKPRLFIDRRVAPEAGGDGCR
jgi:phenylacetate-CoA ligase